MPQQSKHSFVAPSTGSVKKSVSVKEYMEDFQSPVIKETTLPVEVPIQDSSPKIQDNSEINNTTDKPDDREIFLKHWKEGIDLNFQKQPTVYFTLKEYQPEIENNVIYLTVKNELQKEEIGEKKRLLIAHLRNNYRNEIEDIEILVNEEMESKVKILDEREKLKLLHEENGSLASFMKILNMNIKE